LRAPVNKKVDKTRLKNFTGIRQEKKGKKNLPRGKDPSGGNQPRTLKFYYFGGVCCWKKIKYRVPGKVLCRGPKGSGT